MGTTIMQSNIKEHLLKTLGENGVSLLDRDVRSAAVKIASDVQSGQFTIDEFMGKSLMDLKVYLNPIPAVAEYYRQQESRNTARPSLKSIRKENPEKDVDSPKTGLAESTGGSASVAAEGKPEKTPSKKTAKAEKSGKPADAAHPLSGKALDTALDDYTNTKMNIEFYEGNVSGLPRSTFFMPIPYGSEEGLMLLTLSNMQRDRMSSLAYKRAISEISGDAGNLFSTENRRNMVLSGIRVVFDILAGGDPALRTSYEEVKRKYGEQCKTLAVKLEKLERQLSASGLQEADIKEEFDRRKKKFK